MAPARVLDEVKFAGLQLTVRRVDHGIFAGFQMGRRGVIRDPERRVARRYGFENGERPDRRLSGLGGAGLGRRRGGAVLGGLKGRGDVRIAEEVRKVHSGDRVKKRGPCPGLLILVSVNHGEVNNNWYQ
jgi:hypothetical protein